MNASLFTVFVVGLLGSVHCAGMCGGIGGALSFAPRRPRAGATTIALRQVAATPAQHGGSNQQGQHGQVGSLSPTLIIKQI